MKPYLDLVSKILNYGEETTDRTGVGTLSLFGEMLKIDLREGFPLLTTKKVFFKSVVQELLWFLRGETNIKSLGNHIWDEWADENGNLGPLYGYQWTHWDQYEEIREDLYRKTPAGINQIERAVELIKKDPASRRIIVSAWNVSDLDKMRLPPCHMLFQFKVYSSHLDMLWVQRSCDMGLGIPFNIASYALLLSLVSNECNLQPRFLTALLGDAHIYKNHIEPLKLQLTRFPGPLPQLVLPPAKKALQITLEDVKLLNYNPQPHIAMEIAV